MLQKIYYLKFIIFSLLIYSEMCSSQQLNCDVVINYKLLNQTNDLSFKDLESKIENFLNETNWTSDKLTNYSKIDCSFLVTLLNFSNNLFTAQFEIKSFRPVFKTNYKTNNFLFKDESVQFRFEENQTIVFSPNRYESDLASLLAFYSYIIIGFDKDSFALNSGYNSFLVAKNIFDYSSSFSNSQMWMSSSNGGIINKFWLIDNLTSSNYLDFKQITYEYSLNGLDLLVENKIEAKKNIINSLSYFRKMNRYRPNSILQQIFFQSKSSEIFNLFSNFKNKAEINRLKDLLFSVAPFYSDMWEKI